MSANTVLSRLNYTVPEVAPPKEIPSGTSPYIAESIRQSQRERGELHQIYREIAERRSQPKVPRDATERLLRGVELEKERERLGIPNLRVEREQVRTYWRSTKGRVKSPEFDKRISRQEIIDRDESTCYLCGKVCSPNEIHLDHVIPLSKGGAHTEENVKVACRSCNSRKGAKLLPV